LRGSLRDSIRVAEREVFIIDCVGLAADPDEETPAKDDDNKEEEDWTGVVCFALPWGGKGDEIEGEDHDTKEDGN
jgi:hypothetical protein